MGIRRKAKRVGFTGLGGKTYREETVNQNHYKHSPQNPTTKNQDTRETHTGQGLQGAPGRGKRPTIQK